MNSEQMLDQMIDADLIGALTIAKNFSEALDRDAESELKSSAAMAFSLMMKSQRRRIKLIRESVAPDMREWVSIRCPWLPIESKITALLCWPAMARGLANALPETATQK
jgi:hypothetical protein